MVNTRWSRIVVGGVPFRDYRGGLTDEPAFSPGVIVRDIIRVTGLALFHAPYGPTFA